MKPRVMKINAIAKETDELETKDAVQISSTHAKKLMDSKEYVAQKFTSQYLVEMNNFVSTCYIYGEKYFRAQRL